MLYPFIFKPIFKDRIWGGRELEKLFGKKIPAGNIGEAWEISDRPGDASVIANGNFAGNDLRWLMEHHAAEILGQAKPAADGRFPLLCKILDAREKLSLQVHPPARKAAELKGEPKTEMWFIAAAAPDASLYVGLKRGVTRAEFEQKISDGSVADCFHKIPVRAGDTMFLPSGRVHAIGEGLVIFEVQQNSDTTYRVFDWNRVGLDGQARELHIAQSLASIDFSDFEPKLVESKFQDSDFFKSRRLVDHPLFTVLEMQTKPGKIDSELKTKPGAQKPVIVALTKGGAKIADAHSGIAVDLKPGDFCLLPACLEKVGLQTLVNTSFLWVEAN